MTDNELPDGGVQPPDGLPPVEIKLADPPKGKTPKVHETVTDSYLLNPRHPLYSVPVQTVLPDGWEGNPCEYRFGGFGRVKFQQGPVKAGINGIGIEHLLALVEHRLAHFQRGDHACGENAHALQAIRDAQYFLMQRTDKRLNRIPQEDE